MTMIKTNIIHIATNNSTCNGACQSAVAKVSTEFINTKKINY